MVRQSVELISPTSVYQWFWGGLVLAAVGLYLYGYVPKYASHGAVLVLVGGVLVLVTVIRVRNPRLVLHYAANPRRTVMELVEEWKPEPGRLESQYEKSLYDFLCRNLPFVKITRQYGAARVKCDLAVGKDVMIELKAGFRSTQKLQRLIGQIELYNREWKKPVIVVLLGETEQDLLHDLHRSLREYDNVHVVTKEIEGVAADKE
jgi:hypothetical protein